MKQAKEAEMAKTNPPRAAPKAAVAASYGDDGPNAYARLEAKLEEILRRDAERQRQLEQLAQMNAIECILTNGFQDLSAKLAPLEDLSAAPQAIPKQDQAKLQRLRDSLARPRWTDVSEVVLPQGLRSVEIGDAPRLANRR
jgi:hypothetical protein